MKPSEKCFEIIRESESLELKAYKDPGSKDGLPITIGYGSTIDLDGKKFKLGDIITREHAECLLEWQVNHKAVTVDELLKNTPVNQNQFDALVSLAYNIGESAFKHSTVLKRVRVDPNNPAIKDAFQMWVMNDGEKMDGLVNRRNKEYELYSS